MIISREVDINVNRYGLRVVIPVVQYDSGRQIIFNIVDAELPSGCTSNIFIRKPSGKSVYNTCTVSGNKVTVTLTNQSLSEYGFNDAQIQIIKGEEVVTSFSFILEVKQSDADNAVISKSESTFFQGIVNKAQAVAKTCTEVADSIPSDYSKLSSDVATLNNKPTVNAIQKNGVSLNTITVPGHYACNRCTDTPENYTGWVSLIVLPNGGGGDGASGYVIQIALTFISTTLYVRYCDNGNFSAWEKMPARAEVDAARAEVGTNTAAIATLNNKPTINAIQKNGVSLNTLTTPGQYACNSCTDTPENYTGWVSLIVLPNGSGGDGNPKYVTQVAFTLSSTTLYVRYCDNGNFSAWVKQPTRSEIDANKTAITANTNAIATLNNNLGGYKLVGYTPSVVMDKAGEYIIPYPSGENFGTVYGILSATFLLGGYCLPYPPLTPSKSPSFDISEAVSMRITSSGIILNTGGGWGAESRDIYFVLICKA